MDDLAENIGMLLRRNALLEEENKQLRLALALLQWKPEPKKRGRKLRHDEPANESLLQAVEALIPALGVRTFPQLARLLEKQKPLSERFRTVEREAHIKDIQNRLARARKARKSRKES